VNVFAPFLTTLFNWSLSLGVVPPVFKAAYITPRLKKPDLDPADVKSFRPISNLTVLSKVLESLVARQLLDHVRVHRLLPNLQSAYRAQHSTETAVLKVLSDILTAADRGELSMLTLLDLSAAFDTVDHPILLRRLMTSHGVNGVVHTWISSYFANRSQCVRRLRSRLTPLPVLCGVSQGSVLGPILFLLYTADLVQLVKSFELYLHLYADDAQIYGFCQTGDTDSLRKRVADCVAAVADWMHSNRLQLNASKTEVLWCASARRQSQLPSNPLAVGSDLVSPVRCVRDLGIFIDADLTMRTQVTQICSKCFAALRQLRSIRRSVSNDVMQSLIVALVFSGAGATLAGLLKQLMDRLPSVQNAAAWLIFKACRQDHIQPLLCRLHWLRMPERVSFQLAVLVYRCLHGSAPGYLASDLQRVSHLNARR